ncbi:MAG: hypothetical protein CMN00_00785 [Rickettsiales bacterium]|nr:hypothetical protein [Rickettsiales bacterium]|tara:strand:- start:68 stop:529 length:462 start_codon:yes stop_codon:yes gene_type:complete
MKLKIISIGKFSRDCPYSRIFQEYKKRISNISLIEIRSLNSKNKLSLDEKKNYEKKIIFQHFKDQERIIVLDRKGKDFSSIELSNFFQKQMLNSIQDIIFIIGGPDGLADSFFKDFESISFGKNTWPHLLIRVMLIEQIYRSLQIIEGHPYHK